MTRPLTPPPPAPAFDPDDDDRLIGRVLTRREVLALMGAASVTVVAAACAPGLGGERRGIGRQLGDRHGRDDGPGRLRGGGRELPALLRRRPGADRGPVLRQREPGSLGHPDRHVGRLDQRGRGPDDRLGRVAGRRQRVHPARGRPRRRLALRRGGRVFRRRQRAGPRLPARLPAHRRGREGPDRDDLSRAGTRVARSTSTSRSGPTRPRPAASSSRRSCSSTTPSATRSTARASTRRRASPTCRTPATASTSRARG